jgi:hypothetical protein
MNVGMVPDYTNRETTNLFASATTADQSWTVDRNGYICVGGTVTAGDVKQIAVHVNNKVVFNDRANGTTNLHRTWTVPVTRGDVVLLKMYGTTFSEVFCNFIPPKFVTVQAPNIVISSASYSTDEMKTGERWIGGKPIYKRTFIRTNLAFVDNAAILFLGFTEPTSWIDKVVKHEMTFQRVINLDNAFTGVTNLKLLYVRHFSSTTGWGIYVAVHEASEAADRHLTLYYTKTTD